MPKKRVGVTLRKPSPAPEGDTASAPAGEPDATPSPPPASHLDESSDSAGPEPVTQRKPDLPSEGPRPTPVESDIRELGAAPATAIDAFVSGAAAALEKAASQIPSARLRALIERGHDGYRELVLYLPEKLAQALALHCTERNLDMGRVVARAIELHLDELRGVSRPRPDGTSSSGNRAARGLLRELAEWVRTLWATRAKWTHRPSTPAPQDASG